MPQLPPEVREYEIEPDKVGFMELPFEHRPAA
jgi:hypothetical protein